MSKMCQLAATEPIDMLKILKDYDFWVAFSLHELGQSLNCKIKGIRGPKSYKITYSLSVPKRRTLFVIECNEEKLRVKANLFRISEYQKEVDISPDKIKNIIKSTRACYSCNPRCTHRSSYTIDGEKMLPCCYSGHYFIGLEAFEWERLFELIKMESMA